MESKIRHGYDASLVLRAPGLAALTADTVTTKVDINRISKSAYGVLDGKYEQREFAVVLHLGAGFVASTDNVYVLNFNTYDASGNNAVTHATKTFVAADVGKTLVFPFDTGTLQAYDADAALFAIALDVTGTDPSATFYAFIAPAAI